MSKEKGKKVQGNRTLVVGIGASAGGLDPLKEFFKNLPEDTGMAFIVVMHLSPDKESNLAQILQRETSLNVVQVEKKTSIKSDHIYVIPPHKLLYVENDHLQLSEPEKDHGLNTIDRLFQTLAEKKKMYSTGIILSGTGRDGNLGMQAIRSQGGMTIAQDPDEAKYSSMPLSAINTSAIDKVLSVKEMAEELKHYRESLSRSVLPDHEEFFSDEEDEEELLSKIFEQVRTQADHDFSNYRRSTLLRRIDRRMRVNHVQSISEYLNYLEEFPGEADELFKDLLISVTQFLRDPKAFKALEKEVIPKLFEGKERNDQVRVWVPGCATGEEAYSIAILLKEYLANLSVRPEIQIFATDVDENALEKAREGRYPQSIEGDLSPKRLRSFFKENGKEYVVKQELRDMILFASHDLLRNPPFSTLDLISCRNLLIYLNKDLQTEVFNLFHYALRDAGFLFLGKSDSKLGAEEFFETENNEFRLYRKKQNINSRYSLPDLPLLYKPKSVGGKMKTASRDKANIEKLHWSILARLYAPQSVILTRDYEVIHSTEGIKKYLEYPGGEPSNNILDMVKPEIRQALRHILYQLKSEEVTNGQKRIQIKLKEPAETLDLIVRNFNENDFPTGIIHIVFKEVHSKRVPAEAAKKTNNRDNKFSKEDAKLIESLENELEYTKEQLQLSVEEYETSNEELRASNEELQSMNEELQSITEELETSKEELQSLNEELTTVNDQLENKVEELQLAHSDLENLMEATEIGIVFVDREFCIQRFTSASAEIFNLIESDKGRPLQHITHSLDYDSLLDDIEQVLNSLDKIRKVVTDKNGRWFIMRMRPYHSSENKIEGVVLSFTEFTQLKEAQKAIEEQDYYQETLANLGVYALEQDNLPMVLHRAMQQSLAILNLDCGAILALDEKKNKFTVATEVSCGYKNGPLDINKEWDVGYSLHSKDPVAVIDYDEETRFKMSPLAEGRGFVSSLQIAIQGREKVFGVLAVFSQDIREFSRNDLNFIQVLANILGRAIELKKAQDELQEINDRLQKEIKRSETFQKDLLNNSVLERWELGGYLHDTFGQLLATTKILVDDLKLNLEEKEVDVSTEVREINQVIDSCIEGVRNVVHDIIPIDIEKEGVAQAFRFLMKQAFRLHNVNCHLESDDVLEEIKNREAATHLYHIVQEAIKNSVTHGKADTIIISVRKKGRYMELNIKDDGVGLGEIPARDGRGLRIMKHRVELINGTFHLNNVSDTEKTGTLITCKIPLETLRRKKKKAK